MEVVDDGRVGVFVALNHLNNYKKEEKEQENQKRGSDMNIIYVYNVLMYIYSLCIYTYIHDIM